MHLFDRWMFHLYYYHRQPPPWDTGITPPEVIEFLDSHLPGRALDLGCGSGTNVITLAKHGWQVTGIDYAWSAIRIARHKAQLAGVKVDLKVKSVTQLQGFNDRFDLILDIGCFHNLAKEERPVYVRHIQRLLNHSGTYLLYVHIKSESACRGTGVSESDLERIATCLRLISRQNGTERGHHASAWLTYQQPIKG